MSLTSTAGPVAPPYSGEQDLTLSNNMTYTGTQTRTSQVYHFPARAGSQGATGTWSIANDTGVATVAASQTAATFCIPLALKQGDIITSFMVSGQLESGGNTATVDADLRATTAATADLTDASVGAITQISKTADYKIADSKTGLSHTVISGNSYYVLLTVTTAASTDVAIQGVEVTVTEK